LRTYEKTMRNWIETSFQVQSRTWLDWVPEPKWGHYSRCSRSKYVFSSEVPGAEAAAYAKAIAKIEKFKKFDELHTDAKYRLEYRIVKITKTTTVETV